MPIIDFAHVWNTIPFPAFIINSEFIIIEGNSAAEQVVQTSHNQMSVHCCQVVLDNASLNYLDLQYLTC